MKKKLIVFMCIITSLFCYSPINTNAKTNTINANYSTITTSNNVNMILDINDYLGNPSDNESVAWLLQTLLDYIKIIGPILVVVLSSADFIVIIVKGDDESMAKATKKLITRLILAALLFFIPTLVEVLLNIFGFSSNLGGLQ